MTTLRTADPAVDRAFALAVAQAETLVRRAEGITDAEQSRLAAALLGAGIRAPAKELLRRGGRSGQSVTALAEAYRLWVGEEFENRETDSAGPQDLPMAIAEAAAELVGNPTAPVAIARMLESAIAGLWGLSPDARSAAVSVRPELPADWRSMALTRLRIGRTVLDLELRRLRAGLGMHMRRVTGPALIATVEPRPPSPGPTVVDDVELAGSRVRFEVAGRHELVLHVPAQ